MAVEALQHICPQLNSESSQECVVMKRQTPVFELLGIKAGFLVFFPVAIKNCHLSLLEDVLSDTFNITYHSVYSSKYP